MKLDAFGACVAGAAHLARGKTNQDALCFRLDVPNYAIAAVADGHGSESCPYSGEGSAAAAEIASGLIAEALEAQPGRGAYAFLDAQKDIWLPKQIEFKWKARVRELHKKSGRPAHEPFDYALYGTTLAVLALTGSFIFALQIGDGDILIMKDGGLADWLVEPEYHPGNETYSLCMEQCWQYARTALFPIDEKTRCMAMLSTDGYANCFTDGAGFKKAGADFFSLWLSRGSGFVSRCLEPWIMRATAEGSGDDITAAFVLGGEGDLEKYADISEAELNAALSAKQGAKTDCASFRVERLQGGNVGDVFLVTADAPLCAETARHKLVLKSQRRWERFGDLNSWRREYDLYSSSCLDALPAGSLKLPKCFLAELNDDATRLWMEFAEGRSGVNLTIFDMVRAARAIGEFQGIIYRKNPAKLKKIKNLSQTTYLEDDFKQWGVDSREHKYLRSGGCEIPGHLREMLINLDACIDSVFERIRTLPVVFCHRDYWIENIFCGDGGVTAIDWDTSGWGYFGEDLASLIADDTEIEKWGEYFERLLPAYISGASGYIAADGLDTQTLTDIILVKYGYRFVFRYLNSEDSDCKDYQIKSLQKLCEINGR
ncbi:MAG: protein phosphatase 2C domain-containing protein [Defluviitaleaceae bacterium]|nr:protein phosphatase 2C domain-containing protein [Defluviitaleaceae bacterium]